MKGPKVRISTFSVRNVFAMLTEACIDYILIFVNNNTNIDSKKWAKSL